MTSDLLRMAKAMSVSLSVSGRNSSRSVCSCSVEKSLACPLISRNPASAKRPATSQLFAYVDPCSFGDFGHACRTDPHGGMRGACCRQDLVVLLQRMIEIDRERVRQPERADAAD